MFARYFMIFAAVLVVAACSSTDDESLMDDQMIVTDDGVSDAPLSTIYGEDLQGPSAGTQADLVTNVGDRIYFGTDRFDLSAEARSVLEAQATWLAQFPNLAITIEGHADERGTREYNLALGDRRANSVKSYLVALGVSPSQINAISFGKERPAVPGAGESAWAQNRRSVTRVD